MQERLKQGLAMAGLAWVLTGPAFAQPAPPPSAPGCNQIDQIGGWKMATQWYTPIGLGGYLPYGEVIWRKGTQPTGFAIHQLGNLVENRQFRVFISPRDYPPTGRTATRVELKIGETALTEARIDQTASGAGAIVIYDNATLKAIEDGLTEGQTLSLKVTLEFSDGAKMTLTDSFFGDANPGTQRGEIFQFGLQRFEQISNIFAAGGCTKFERPDLPF